MSKKVMVCFDYERDLWRANRVLNTWESKLDWDVTGFADVAAWQNVKLRGTYGVNRWVTDELYGTSATIILIGTLTSKQAHVLHAIQQSVKQGNGLVLIDIHNIRDQDLKLAPKGQNPVEALTTGAPPANKVAHFDWVSSDGAKNLDSWLTRVAK